MASDRILKVKIIGDSKNIERAFGRVSSAGSTMGSKVGSVFSGLARSGAVLATGVTAGVFGAFKLANASSDLGEAQSKSNVTFGEGAAAIEQFGKTAARQFGLSKRAATDFASGFGGLLKNAGMEGGALTGMSTDLTALTGDLSSFNNIASEDVFAKLRAGLGGEAEGLKDLNIFINAAAVDAKVLELGLEGVNGEISESAKIQARAALIFEQSADAQGDFSRTSEGLANQQRILGAQWENMQSTLGEKLAPVAAKFFNLVSTKMPAVIDWLGPRISAAVDMGAKKFEQWWPTIRDSVKSAIEWLGPKLVKGVEIGRKAIDAMVKWTKKNWPEIRDTAKAVFDRVADIISKFVKLASAFWDKFGDEIISTAKIVWDTVKGVIDSATKIIGRIIDTFTAVLEGDWSAVWENLKGIVSESVELIKGFVSGAFDALWGLAKAGLDGLVDGAGEKVGELVGWFAGLPGRIADALGDLGGVLWGAGRDLIQGLWNGATGIFADFANWLIDKVNWAAGLVNWLPGVSVNIPNVDTSGLDPDSGGGSAGAGGVSTSRRRPAPNSDRSPAANVYEITNNFPNVDPVEAWRVADEGDRLQGTSPIGGFR